MFCWYAHAASHLTTHTLSLILSYLSLHPPSLLSFLSSSQVDLMMAFILQYIVAKRGRKNKETEIQMKRLVAADDQDDEEEE